MDPIIELLQPRVPFVVSDEMRAAYAAACYEAELPRAAGGSPEAQLSGSGAHVLSLVVGEMTPELPDEASRLTLVTGWNPFSREQPAAINDAANARLQACIHASGHAFLPASGHDPNGLWGPEPGFAVLDAGDELLDEWLSEFGQFALVDARRGELVALRWHPLEASRVRAP